MSSRSPVALMATSDGAPEVDGRGHMCTLAGAAAGAARGPELGIADMPQCSTWQMHTCTGPLVCVQTVHSSSADAYERRQYAAAHMRVPADHVKEAARSVFTGTVFSAAVKCRLPPVWRDHDGVCNGIIRAAWKTFT